MLKELLSAKKSDIVGRWIRSIADSYPAETSKFLRLQKDRFSNPVGFSVSECAVNIFDEIIGDVNPVKIKDALRDIIKIRAVQEFSPSQAAGFIFPLKRIIHEAVKDEIRRDDAMKEMMELNSIIDDIALAAFDLYMEAREKIFQIRVKEIKAKILFNEMNGAVE